MSPETIVREGPNTLFHSVFAIALSVISRYPMR